MIFLNSLCKESSRRTLLVFFFMSSILPLLIMTLMIYEYIIPSLIPEKIDRLIDLFTFGLAAMLLSSVISFFLMSRRKR
jgi:ATP/ADP translocase